ncbi:MAG: 1-acyl-sn-glycerol-3-phosphate acyltransferase [Bacteroidetes bacterium]|uniref:1-acyl-sn-glycerol-3-phosphate acyltransferase n=1 Tax=Candidatus Cryptobacteroides intestinavium TaxID=2840766 RepID=A0A9D9HHW3_9BACT|nr:1-acyl-sn-glycerol-3-phosphate acyltransferase [Candidatus Cryptobacteroides intestinavium]
MVDLSKFESISPYTDAEAVEALSKVADNPLVTSVSQYFFPDKEPGFLTGLLKSVKSVDEFQVLVMSRVVEWVLAHTAHNFSYDGIKHIDPSRKFLAMSNHRDIILDPAITQLVLYRNNIPMTEIAVGDNLLTNPFIEYLIRSNRMIKVVRGISARELYLSSQLLSEYIRLNITTGKSSIWLAQRQGRTKDGADITEQGLLKMLDMSGKEDFLHNFRELNIIPLSISYEIEPCDVLKARELLISRTQKYVKADGEDLHSIITGIKQQKGNIHLHIGEQLTDEEIAEASLCDKNDRYQLIRHAVDLRVIDGYRLWKTNYIAYDMLNPGDRYREHYSKEDVEWFIDYKEHQLDTVEPELDRAALNDIFLHIYANPVVSKEMLYSKQDLPAWNR